MNLEHYQKFSSKRARTESGAGGSTPGGVGSFGVHPSGPHTVPRLGNPLFGPMSSIPTQGVGSQIHQQTNNTGSIPLIIKPTKDNYEKHYTEGTMLFINTDIPANKRQQPISAVLDVCTLNLQLKDLVLSGKQGEAVDMLQKYEYFGVLRNEPNFNHKTQNRQHENVHRQQRLVNVDIYGRSAVPDIFGALLKTGDQIGFRVRHTKSKDTSETFFPQLYPAVNGKIIQEYKELEPDLREKVFPIGTVSHRMHRVISEHEIKSAMEDTKIMSKIPKVEILIV
jgi:hypothetical protein